MSDRRLKLALMRENLPTVLTAIALLAVVATGAGLIWYSSIVRYRLASQASREPLLTGFAEVTDVIAVQAKRSNYYSKEIHLKMNGTIVVVRVNEAQEQKAARTRIGQTVAVRYHTLPGKITVVDDWDPPATKAPITTRGGSE